MSPLAAINATTSLVPVYYVLGILAILCSGLAYTRKYLRDQKRRWTSEGKQQQNLAESIESNTLAAKENTKAIRQLSDEMHAHMARTDMRLALLEDTRPPRRSRSASGST